MLPPDSSAGTRYRPFSVRSSPSIHDDAGIPPVLTIPVPTAMARAMQRLNAGETSFAETVEAFRALGLTTHQATVAVSVQIASQSPHARSLWRARRRKRFAPPRW